MIGHLGAQPGKETGGSTAEHQDRQVGDDARGRSHKDGDQDLAQVVSQRTENTDQRNETMIQ